MKTSFCILLILLCGVLSADPRGLTSREISIEDAVSVIQPETDLTLPVPAVTCSQEDFRDTWNEALAHPLGIMLPAKAQFGLRFNNLTQSGEYYSSLGDLLPETLAAVAKAPGWIRPELHTTLNQLAPDRQLLFAELINNTLDPYVDEVAFCVATASPQYLNSDFAMPELFTENAQRMYSADTELQYVEIVDTGSSVTDGYYYSTTRYWKKDASGQLQQVTVPMEVYYWYLVNPKITDEIQAYIDPAIVENNTTHSNNIAPPPVGKFWRSYIYDFEEAGYPVLSDTLALCQTVFNRDGSPGDAVRGIIWWINQNMSFTSNAERPHQPVRIFEKRIGRCGEYADLTSAVARTALIPCTNISSISTDHTWNEFWDEGWVSWEPVNGYLNNPLVYENGWGKVFGSVFEERSDGLFSPVTDRYSEGLATINIQVVDQNMQPVDAARVVLAIFETSPRFDCEQYTDNNGMVSFTVGENRDYRARAETFFGLYPANPGTYAQLVSNSEDGETYAYQFVISAAMP
ncbi:MAG: transglutaminase-like domain-containing protein, partial [Candidatus Syntrophosphaera sp.]|nr:transglutaminase-like domain-containing protein [Candidatus Syntrophosphaera sp.]